MSGESVAGVDTSHAVPSPPFDQRTRSNLLATHNLSTCFETGNSAAQAHSKSVNAAVRTYLNYGTNMGPILNFNGSDNIRALRQQHSRWHGCNRGKDVIGGYRADVPASATAAVVVFVHYWRPLDPGDFESFMTVAQIPGKGWRVFGVGTTVIGI